MKNHLIKLAEEINKMSSLKKISIVFFILIIFIIIVEKPGSDLSKRNKNIKFIAPKLAVQNVGKIEIIPPHQSDKKLTLEKRKEIWWLVNGHSFPADEQIVNETLNAIHDLKEESIVSKNPDRMSLFEVDEANGIEVIVWDERERKVADFYLGKTNSLGQQYLRQFESDHVLLVNQNLSSFISREHENWKDKTILRLDESKAKQLTLKSSTKEINLNQTDQQWQWNNNEDKNLNNLALRTLIEQIKHVQADNFAEVNDGSQVDFNEPDYQLSILLDDETLQNVAFKKAEKENFYFVKTNQNDFVYQLSEKAVNRIFELNLEGETN